MRIRDATEDDLRRLAEIKAEAVAAPGWEHPAAADGGWAGDGDAGAGDAGDGSEAVAPIAHVLANGRVLLAERDGRAVAFASAVVREGVWYLSQLFARPAAHGGGGGAALLDALLAEPMAREARVRATVSSRDPRAFGLYLSRGLLPRWQLLGLSRRGAPDPDPESPVEPLGAGDAAAVDDLDHVVRGFARTADHALFAHLGSGFGLRDDAGRLAAYLYVVPGDRCGPIAARDEGWFARALDAAIALGGPATSFTVPSVNEAGLRHLLGRGFRPRNASTFCADGDVGPFRPYAPAGALLL